MNTAPYKPIDIIQTESEPVDAVLDDIIVSSDETSNRISFCATCENNTLNVIPKCNQCDCSISMLTTLSFKSCPIGKW